MLRTQSSCKAIAVASTAGSEVHSPMMSMEGESCRRVVVLWAAGWPKIEWLVNVVCFCDRRAAAAFSSGFFVNLAVASKE